MTWNELKEEAERQIANGNEEEPVYVANAGYGSHGIVHEIHNTFVTVESDSIESFPNPNIKLKFSCEVIKDEGKY